MALGCFWRTVLFAMMCAVKFSVFIGVYSWVCPISCKVVWIVSDSLPLCKRAPTSDSAAYPIIFFIVLDTLLTVPFVSLVIFNFGIQ